MQRIVERAEAQLSAIQEGHDLYKTGDPKAPDCDDPEREAAQYVTREGAQATEELRIPDAAAALQGARDIIAETINDNAQVRAAVRQLFLTKGTIKSEVITGKEEEGAKFKDYFAWSELIATAPSHRVLAIRRGTAEGFTCSRSARWRRMPWPSSAPSS